MFFCVFSLFACYIAVIVIRIAQNFLRNRPVCAAIVKNPSLALRALKLYLYTRSERARSERTPVVQAKRIHYKIKGIGDVETQSIEKDKSMFLLDRSKAQSVVIDYVYEGCFDYKMAISGVEKGALVEDVNSAVLKRLDIQSGHNTVYSVTSSSSDPEAVEAENTTRETLMQYFGPRGSPPELTMFDHFDPSVKGVYRVNGTEKSFDVDFCKRTISVVSSCMSFFG